MNHSNSFAFLQCLRIPALLGRWGRRGLLLMAFTGHLSCQKVVEEKPAVNPLNGKPSSNFRIVDLSSCNALPDDKGSVYTSPWLDISRADRNVIVTETLIFRPGILTKRTVCSYDGTSVEVKVSTDIAVNEGAHQLTILKSVGASKPLKFSSETFNCTSEILATTKPLKVQFAGTCLFIGPDDSNMTSYPPSYW